MFKTYLGDYVYAELDEQTHELVLTTENGTELTNRIVLGPDELLEFLAFLRKRGELRAHIERVKR